ncbi:MAG: hypothetical protein LC104_00800 [Bacteroidales bacterium]|nr:hypothetical protein [Bacteroidales bacterium]
MTPREYVEQQSREGTLAFILLLAHGREFVGRTRSSTVRSAARWKDRVKPKWQRCFSNAGEFCLAHADAEYWEGFWDCGLDTKSLHHAWVVLDGHVIDFTAEDMDRRIARKLAGVTPLPPADNTYFGVHVPTTFIRRRVEQTRMWESVSELYLLSLPSDKSIPSTPADTLAADMARSQVALELRGSEELRQHQEQVQREQDEVKSAERRTKIAELKERRAVLQAELEQLRKERQDG